MNLGELRAAVRSRSGYTSSDAKMTDAVVNDAVNVAARHLATVADWAYLNKAEDLTCTPGDATLTHASLHQRTKSLTVQVDENYHHTLDELPVTRLDDFWGDPQIPLYWCEWGGVINLRPAPDAAYTVVHRYVAMEPEMSADSDEPLATVEFQDALVEYACYQLFLRDHDMKMAEAKLASFAQSMAVLRDNRRRGGAPVVPQIRPWAP